VLNRAPRQCRGDLEIKSFIMSNMYRRPISNTRVSRISQSVITEAKTGDSIMTLHTLKTLKKKWSAEAMDKAINAVLNEGMSRRCAAEHYAISDRISGRALQVDFDR